MAVLLNTRHERFAQAVASGSSPTNAYVSAGYKKAGAAQNAARLLRDDKVRARLTELQTSIAASVVTLEISNRNARLQAQQERCSYCAR
jgi:phage terminase small subunit